ncbi:unnamed protein product [Arabidopsis lyrata]|nr:unnamed protein product [Arabidopsis lyrata]
MATELSLTMRGGGFINVEDLLKMHLKTSANIQLKSHTVDEIREAVRRDNKQRFSLIDENRELLTQTKATRSRRLSQRSYLNQSCHQKKLRCVCMELIRRIWNPSYHRA